MFLIPDSKVHVANMVPIWGRQDPGGPHVGHMNFAIWDLILQLPLPNPLENEDVVWAALIGDAPTTSEWSTIILPNKVRLIFEVWWYLKLVCDQDSSSYLNYELYILYWKKFVNIKYIKIVQESCWW